MNELDLQLSRPSEEDVERGLERFWSLSVESSLVQIINYLYALVQFMLVLLMNAIDVTSSWVQPEDIW